MISYDYLLTFFLSWPISDGRTYLRVVPAAMISKRRGTRHPHPVVATTRLTTMCLPTEQILAVLGIYIIIIIIVIIIIA